MLSEPFVSSRAVEALAKLHDEKALAPLIRLFEEEYNPSLATVLGHWGDARAVEPLMKAMGCPHSHVRFYAARALGNLGDDRAIPVLEWARDNDTTPITDTKSLHGKSVASAAGAAIEKIRATQ